MREQKKLIISVVIAIILILLCSFLISSCNDDQLYIQATTKSGKELGHDRFVVNEQQGGDIIYVDTETGVSYWWRNGRGMTVLVDHNGKPVIAKGFRDGV